MFETHWPPRAADPTVRFVPALEAGSTKHQKYYWHGHVFECNKQEGAGQRNGPAATVGFLWCRDMLSDAVALTR